MFTILNLLTLNKVGFLLNFPLDYKGGINYLKNLFYAVHNFQRDNIQITLFVSNDISAEYLEMFSPYVTIVRTKILKRKSLSWFCSKTLGRFFNFDFITYLLLKKYDIAIVSHSNFIFCSKKIKYINWIPDFQYLHYSDLWSKAQLSATEKLHRKLIIKSDAIVLSSDAAFNDFKINHLKYQDKVSVLNFVSQPDQELEVLFNNVECEQIKDLYKINRPFFYCPNQFWSHKNHYVIFEAVKLLKDRGFDPLVLTSGLMNDYRNGANHVEYLEQFVTDNSLDDNILFLGLIPYKHVVKLILMADCIINPSLFEGWSSSVEEAKIFGKKILLSNILVHIEQAPKFGIYFDPRNPTDLSNKMEDLINESKNEEIDLKQLRADLNERTRIFAFKYFEILNNLQKIS